MQIDYYISVRVLTALYNAPLVECKNVLTRGRHIASRRLKDSGLDRLASTPSV